MNRLAYTAFVAFWASLATLLAVALLSVRSPENRGQPGAAGPEAPSRATGLGGPGGEAAAGEAEEDVPLVSLEELARHDDRESCWKAIHGKVYDVTEIIDLHPTPPPVMLEWCGREATEAWETKGYGEPHSPAAEAMLEEYLVGRLAQPPPAPGRPGTEP